MMNLNKLILGMTQFQNNKSKYMNTESYSSFVFASLALCGLATGLITVSMAVVKMLIYICIYIMYI